MSIFKHIPIVHIHNIMGLREFTKQDVLVVVVVVIVVNNNNTLIKIILKYRKTEEKNQ